MLKHHLENKFISNDQQGFMPSKRRATRLVPELRGSSYEDRLNKTDLTNLQVRKQRGDFIQMFKIINNLEKVNLVTERK